MSVDAGAVGTGGTRWRRFALVMVGGLIVAAVMVVALAQGAIAASFAVASVPFKISSDELRAQGLVQYTGVERTDQGGVPVIINGLRKAEADNFCQSILMNLPIVGAVTVRFEAPGKNGFSAQNIVVSTERLTGDLTLVNGQIGRDASTLDLGPPGTVGPAGTFGLQAVTQTLDHSQQVSRAVTAATLKLSKATVATERGRHECFG